MSGMSNDHHEIGGGGMPYIPQKGEGDACLNLVILTNLASVNAEVLKKTEARVAAVNAAHPSDPSRPVQWPGEGTAKRRAKSKERGVTANEKVWEEVCRLAAR